MPYAISINHSHATENTSARCTLNQFARTLPRIAHQLGQLLCCKGGGVPNPGRLTNTPARVGTHQLRPITDWLLDDHGPSVSAQNEFKKQLVLRSRALGYNKNNPLFIFTNNRVQSETVALREGDSLITTPLDNAKLVLADLYQKKYGIRIVIETCQLNKAQLAKKIKLECRQARGKPVGLILQTTMLGESKDMGGPEGNYAGHVTPIVVQQSGRLIHVVALDSALQPNSELIRAMLHLSRQNINVGMITLNKARQADHFSCHTDALQILKDLLTQHQNTSRSIFNDLSVHRIAEEDQFKSAVNLLKIELPSFLQKVNQRLTPLGHDDYSHAQLLQAPLAPLKAEKCQTVVQHWHRYSRHPGENPDKLHNHFLAVKAFHNANKVLHHLESFESARAREEYLQGLHNTFT